MPCVYKQDVRKKYSNQLYNSECKYVCIIRAAMIYTYIKCNNICPETRSKG